MTETNTPNLQEIFKDDSFNTRSHIESTVHPLVEKLLPQGAILAINAPFGMGKTTFCNLYCKYLRAYKQYNSTVLDVFLHDYHAEPFIAVNKGLDKIIDQESSIKLSFREAVVDILRSTTITEDYSKPNQELINHLFSAENSLHTKVKHYKERLATLIKDKPTIIFIDELDCCDASLVLLFLGRLKNYLENVPNLIFILTINQMQLTEVIKYNYGITDLSNYLKKFLSMPVIDLHSTNHRHY